MGSRATLPNMASNGVCFVDSCMAVLYAYKPRSILFHDYLEQTLLNCSVANNAWGWRLHQMMVQLCKHTAILFRECQRNTEIFSMSASPCSKSKRRTVEELQ